MAKSWIHKPASPPTKQCPSCNKWLHSRLKQCPNCATVLTETSPASDVGTSKKTVHKKRVKRRMARRPAPAATRNGSSLEAAIRFVEAAGGVKQARQALDTIEKIRGL